MNRREFLRTAGTGLAIGLIATAYPSLALAAPTRPSFECVTGRVYDASMNLRIIQVRGETFPCAALSLLFEDSFYDSKDNEIGGIVVYSPLEWQKVVDKLNEFMAKTHGRDIYAYLQRTIEKDPFMGNQKYWCSSPPKETFLSTCEGRIRDPYLSRPGKPIFFPNPYERN